MASDRTTRWANAALMLFHRLRRWPNIKLALVSGVLFAVMHSETDPEILEN